MKYDIKFEFFEKKLSFPVKIHLKAHNYKSQGIADTQENIIFINLKYHGQNIYGFKNKGVWDAFRGTDVEYCKSSDDLAIDRIVLTINHEVMHCAIHDITGLGFIKGEEDLIILITEKWN